MFQKIVALILFIIGGLPLAWGMVSLIYPFLDERAASMTFNECRPFDMVIIWILGVVFSFYAGGLMIKAGIYTWKYKRNANG